jgi:hypothetical protein
MTLLRIRKIKKSTPLMGMCVKLCAFVDAMVYSSALSFSGHLNKRCCTACDCYHATVLEASNSWAMLFTFNQKTLQPELMIPKYNSQAQYQYIPIFMVSHLRRLGSSCN